MGVLYSKFVNLTSRGGDRSPLSDDGRHTFIESSIVNKIEQQKQQQPGEYVPSHYQLRDEFISSLITQANIDSNANALRSPAIRKLEAVIYSNPKLNIYFSHIFDEILRISKAHDNHYVRVQNSTQLLQVLDHIIHHGPSWSSNAARIGLVGLPMFAALDDAMGTISGFAAFLDTELNTHLKAILHEWGSFLRSPASASVLNKSSTGWLNPEALTALSAQANLPYCTNFTFEEIYICDPTRDHHGFTSWDAFFTRQLRSGIRPIAAPEDDNIITHACESVAYNLQFNAQLKSKFWIKSQPYSISDMLADDPLAVYFDGGTVYQAFLTALSYHRWHAPVSGVVRRAFVTEGMYFSIPLSVAEQSVGEVEIDRMVPSQGYLSAMATRGVVIVEADEEAIGMVAFVAVGMSEVSTCDITVREGQRARKGDEIGMFHYGGSSYCMLFRQGLRLEGLPDVAGEQACAVNAMFARVLENDI